MSASLPFEGYDADAESLPNELIGKKQRARRPAFMPARYHSLGLLHGVAPPGAAGCGMFP